MSYIGREAQLQGAYDKVDDISGLFDGTLVTFDIKVNGVNRMIGKATNLVVGIDKALQEPDVDYTVSNYQITFTTAPTAGQQCGITILGDVFKAPATGNTDLNSLTDVVIGSVNDDEVLTYSGGSWINAPQGTTHLSNNTDVDTSAAVNGDKLVFDGTEWKGEGDELNNINDVNAPTPSDNQILTWDDIAGEWQPKDPQSTVDDINDLSDVDTSTNPPSTNQNLTWDGSNWVPADPQSTVDDINDLSDVDTNTVPPLDGQALVWNANSSNWNPGTVSGGGGAESINDLNDVDTSTNPPVIDHTLKWDGTNWVPGPMTGGGGASYIDDLNDVDTTTNSPVVDEVLKWDGTNWVPGVVSGGGNTLQTGNLIIFITSTGNDTTGDGSVSNPYASIYRALEDANNIILQDGIIRFVFESGVTFTLDTQVEINNKNIIEIVSTDGSSFTLSSNLSSSTTPLFKIDSAVEFYDCQINAETIFDISSYGSLYTSNCGLSANLIGTFNHCKYINMTDTYIMIFSNTSVQNPLIFNYCDIDKLYIAFDLSGISSYVNVINFNNCNIKNVEMILYGNNPSSTLRILETLDTNINYLNIKLNNVQLQYLSSGILKFVTTKINNAYFDFGTATNSPIEITEGCDIYVDRYYTSFPFQGGGDGGPKINNNNDDDVSIKDQSTYLFNVIHHSTLKINSMENGGLDNYDGNYTLNADYGSFISVMEHLNFVTSTSQVSNPSYRGGADTFIFSSTRNGSCVYVDYFTYNGGGGK